MVKTIYNTILTYLENLYNNIYAVKILPKGLDKLEKVWYNIKNQKIYKNVYDILLIVRIATVNNLTKENNSDFW